MIYKLSLQVFIALLSITCYAQTSRKDAYFVKFVYTNKQNAKITSDYVFYNDSIFIDLRAYIQPCGKYNIEAMQFKIKVIKELDSLGISPFYPDSSFVNSDSICKFKVYIAKGIINVNHSSRLINPCYHPLKNNTKFSDRTLYYIPFSFSKMNNIEIRNILRKVKSTNIDYKLLEAENIWSY